ncbi:MAG: GNAT family N-acetyltransferase [Candidatus Dormibacteraeota bacterium]|nr:GNAT family N-acetyltransferase [Candidatus Dormibacteraeota bacterium]
MSAIHIDRLTASQSRERIDGLASVLLDCVASGASVSYMVPFSLSDARAAYEPVIDDVAAGKRILLAAFVDATLVGTVQLAHAAPPNQPHRADIAKLLVHRAARDRGVGQALMQRVEVEARAAGKTLLVLDTVTGGAAERLYARLGWTAVGVIPNYALYPDGRPCDTTVFWKDVSRAG